MSIKLFIYSTILIPRVQQLYILASVSLSASFTVYSIYSMIILSLLDLLR